MLTSEAILALKGNMILIKDRHEVELELWKLVVLGKYDTYKGSTLVANPILDCFLRGKYDTYKGSTRG